MENPWEVLQVHLSYGGQEAPCANGSSSEEACVAGKQEPLSTWQSNGPAQQVT